MTENELGIDKKLEIIKHIKLGTSEVLLTKQFLEKEYVNNKKSGREIAKEIGCSNSKVYYWLDKFGIDKRTKSETWKSFHDKGILNNEGKNHPNWKSVINYTKNGYKTVFCPSHPRSNKNRVLFHFLVVEEYLGRFLKKDEIVHHIDGDKLNNDINNLWISNSSKHAKAHKSTEDIVYTLLREGKAKFNRKKGIYEIVDNGD